MAKSKNPLTYALMAMSGQQNVVTVSRALVDFTGSLEAGLLLGQLLYWTERARIPGGWVAKSDNELVGETCLSRHGVRSAREQLEAMGFLTTNLKKFNGAPTTHYLINLEQLNNDFSTWVTLSDCANPDNPIVRNQTMDCANPDNPLCESVQSLTETTSETTPEITTEIKEQQPPQNQNYISAYEQATGSITGLIVTLLDCEVERWNEHTEKLPSNHPDKKVPGAEVLTSAITTAEASKKTPLISLEFVRAILSRWIAEGYQSKRMDRPSYRNQPAPSLDGWTAAN